ncbi:C-5 cytosine-specific DNA methylase family protein [Aeromonas phage ST4]|nr:C-5 cytosine-specific DNA methylase family protein [Aeromonas phage ST4]
MNNNFKTQFNLDFAGEIRVDLFAGGGGASTGTEMGTNLPVDIAINHDENAISMHTANHPHAEHYISDVYEVDPISACRGRPVGHLHASPDCTHHSQAAGGQPRKKAIRSLSWVVHKWAGKVKPRLITLENVEQILNWSPLVAKRCKITGRVVKLDGTVAEPGEIVPIGQQFLVPNKRKKGHNWEHFIQGLRGMGYAVQWRVIAACEFGAPTTRERLFLIARCDGQPIVWPEPTHAKLTKKQASQMFRQAWKTAADCIDWSDLGKSIFNRPRPLADATMKRIARGIQKFVIDAEKPFIVPGVSGFITECANASNQRNMPADEPLRTICATVKGGHFGLVTANMLQLRGNCDARSAEEPLRTISAGGEHHGIVTAFMARQFGKSIGHPIDEPSGAITAGGGGKSQLVSLELSQDNQDGALRCAAFLLQYYSEGGQLGDLNSPMNTITTKDRMALVTVWIGGDPWVIVDIRLRMLKPRELYRAQGFPDTYIIDRGHDGRKFTNAQQVRFVGNSVSPLPMAAIVAANYWPAVNDNRRGSGLAAM